MLKRILIEFNLFKINSNDDNDQFQIVLQRITTRLYIDLLVFSIISLTLSLALIPQIHVKTIKDPTPANFLHLHSHYPSSFQCACSSIFIPYNAFLTIEPHYHQMCSSDIVSSAWLEFIGVSLMRSINIVDRTEYSHNAASRFVLLKKLCTEAEQMITNSLHTKPIIYNGSCNCGLSSQCVQESSTMPGFMVGCYPLESLLQSTLECLYNASCFSRLQSVSRSFAPLNDSSPSRFQKNSTVELILNQLMVEQWNKSITYEKYYAQCAPLLCSYSYIEHRSPLQVLILLLELYGSLMIIMNVVALLLVAIWQKMLIRYRQRRAQVQPM